MRYTPAKSGAQVEPVWLSSENHGLNIGSHSQLRAVINVHMFSHAGDGAMSR
jgi:hypothetical protein